MVRIEEEVEFSLLDDLRVYDAEDETLWQGFIAKMPRESGDNFLVNIQGVGYSAQMLAYLLLVTDRYPNADPTAMLATVERPPQHPVYLGQRH